MLRRGFRCSPALRGRQDRELRSKIRRWQTYVIPIDSVPPYATSERSEENGMRSQQNPKDLREERKRDSQEAETNRLANPLKPFTKGAASIVQFRAPTAHFRSNCQFPLLYKNPKKSGREGEGGKRRTQTHCTLQQCSHLR